MAVSAFSFPENARCLGFPHLEGVSFEDDATYYALDPYLNPDSSKIVVDQYDGGDVKGADIERLIDALTRALNDIESKPEEWIVRTESWEQGGKKYFKEYRASKARLRSVATKLIALAQVTRSMRHRIHFVGD